MYLNRTKSHIYVKEEVMESDTTERTALQFNRPGRAHSCAPTQEGARSTQNQELKLSELLFYIFVRATFIVCLFGLAGCASPAIS